MNSTKKPAPILSPTFVWISSASHDASSEPFRERQRERMRKAQEVTQTLSMIWEGDRIWAAVLPEEKKS